MKIIIVDPLEKDRAQMAALIATAFGSYEVVAVGDYSAYKTALAGEPPALVITAEATGWGEGLALLRELRAHRVGLPVVMVAGAGSEELAVAAMKAGLSDYLPKRHLEQLPQVVRTSLDRAAERSLSDLHLYALLEHMPVLLYGYDPEQGVVFWNREAERVTGYSAAEIIGNPHAFAMLFPDEAYRTTIMTEWARRGSDFRDLELEVAAKDGSRHIIAWSNLSKYTSITDWISWSIGVDVTARHEAQAALRRREQEYALLLEHSPDIIARIDRDLRIQYVSPSIGRLFGMPPELFIGKTTREVGVSEQLTERWEHAAQQVLVSGQTMKLDFTFTRPDEVRIFEAHIAPAYGPGGVPEGLLGVVRDVTLHRRSEERQRFLADAGTILNSSLDYETILKRAARLAVPFLCQGCIIDLLEEGQMRRVAVAHSDPAKEALLHELFQQFPIDPMTDPFAEVLQAGRPVLVPEFTLEAERLRNPAHEEFMRRVGPTNSLMAVPLIVRGKAIGVMIFGITDAPRRYGPDDLALAEELARRLAMTIDNIQLFAESQRLIRQARAQAVALEAIFQHAPVGLSIFDTTAGARCLRHNALALYLCSEYWQRRGSCEGVLLSEMFDVDTYQRIRILFDQALLSGQTITVDEYAVSVWPDPQTRYYSWSVTPLAGVSDEPVTLLVAAVEITARKRAEGERLALERKLLEARKLESLGVLAGGIAHDFNNLLTVMLGNVELALLDALPQSPCATAIQQIELSVQRAAGLIRQLLTYVGGGKVDLRPLGPNSLIAEVVVPLQATLPRLIGLHTSLANGLPSVSADRAQLRQALMNLVVNAAEALEGMPGTITIRTDTFQADRAWLAGALLGDTLPEGRYVLIEVADSGPGMDAATQERIFEPFFTTRFAGRGLGLAAVLGIVRSHQGALKVVSQPGHGATFTILLPSLVVGQAPLSTGATGGSVSIGTILVVDDEPGVREMVAAIVRRLNFQVFSAGDGLEALEIFRARADEIDCVVLDMVMPRMDGAQTFAEMRQIKPDVRVILISGYSPDEMLQRFGSVRPAGFLQKPFMPRDLQALIQQVISRG